MMVFEAKSSGEMYGPIVLHFSGSAFFRVMYTEMLGLLEMSMDGELHGPFSLIWVHRGVHLMQQSQFAA